MTGNGSDRVRFGPFEVDLHTHELWKFGTRLKLVGQPFEILAVLLSRPGELVTREELRNRLWPSDTFVDFNHGLNAAVNKLREALSDSAEKPRYIETLPRRGYRFVAALEALPPSPAPVMVQPTFPADTAVQTSLPPANEPAFSTGIEQPVQPKSHARVLFWAGAVAAVLLIAALTIQLASRSGERASSDNPVQRMRPLLSIADTASPALSPDGNYVAFYRQHSSAAEAGIYVTPVGRENFVQLTNNDDDCCPVWSPDGRWVAFSRFGDKKFSIYLVPSDGGSEQKSKAERAQLGEPAAFRVTSSASFERKLDTSGIVPQRGEIDWSPDGRLIAFAGADGIYVTTPDSPSKVRRITQAPPLSEDWAPKFSFDGNKVLFVRDYQMGLSNELRSVLVSNGEESHIFSEPGRIASPPEWSPDGRSIIFSSNRTGHPVLWRLALDAPDSALLLKEAGSPAWDPVISRRGFRFVYERLFRSLSIWQMDLSASADKRPYVIVSSTSNTDQGPGPQFSPDGTKLAYMSDRSGTMEIWIAHRDGSNAFQLTAVGGAGTPRWSPDSQAIAFDVPTRTGSKIVVQNLHGGAAQVLTQDPYHDVCPSWSRDGKWIYFGSHRSDAWQVWKMPAEGGTAIQVTRRGGHSGLESLDGKYLYYAKTPNAEPEIWRVPVNGGEETLVSLVRPGTWASWQIVEGGIVFVGPSLGHQAVLSFFDFAKERTTTVAVLDRTPFWLGATRDGNTVAFDQPGREESQAMLVENFR